MIARTKQQKLVEALSDSLPAITEEQKAWAFQHCLHHWGYRTKTNTSCMDCGHIWKGEQKVKTCACPACGVTLTMVDTRKKKVYQRGYVAMVTVCEDFQLNRFWQLRGIHKAGQPAKTYIWEIVQQWMRPDGKHEVVARLCGGFNGWESYAGNLEIRPRNTLGYKYNIYPDGILPGAKCLPIYKRNGVNGRVDIKIGPFDLFTSILKDPMAETLLKAKQHDLLAGRCGDRRYDISSYWHSVKICIRQNYIVKEAKTWLDYLGLLEYFKKDLHNAKYVCPANLHRAHNRLVAKKAEIENHKRYSELLKKMGVDQASFKNKSAAGLKAQYDALMAEKKRAQLEKDDINYAKSKGVFFGISFVDGNITIKVLESLQDFVDEGDAHKHCVFTNNYHKKEDSLILRALVGGKPMETIEVQLSTMKVLQARGKGNMPTKYHEEILKLLNKNMRVIKARAKEAKLMKSGVMANVA